MVPVTQVRRYSQPHHDSIECWLYNAQIGEDDALLGKIDEYIINEL